MLYKIEKSKYKLLHITKKLAFDILCKKLKNLPSEVKDLLEDSYDFFEIDFSSIAPPNLRRIFIDLTNICNYKCKNCFHMQVKGPGLASEKVLNQLTNIPSDEQTTLAILGGEPLLYPRPAFENYLQKWAAHFKNVSIYTNGSLLDAGLIDLCKRNKVNIHLTFYAVAKDKHDSYTGMPGAFDNLQEKIQLLRKNENRFGIALVLDGDDMALYRQKKTIFTEMPLLKFVRFVEIRRPNLACFQDVPLIEAKKSLYAANSRPIGPVELNGLLTNLKYHPCHAGIISIATDGNIYNCPMDQHKSYGNLTEIDFNKVDLSDLLNWQRPLSTMHTACAQCEFNFLCRKCDYVDKVATKLKKVKTLKKPFFCQYNPEKGIYG